LNDDKIKDEKQKFKDLECVVLIEYIRSSIEILLNLKMEDDDGRSCISKQSGPSKANFMSINSEVPPDKLNGTCKFSLFTKR